MNIKGSGGRLLMGCLGALLIALPGLTNAVCTQENIRGTWYVVGITGDTQGSHLVQTTRCKIVVGSTGAIPATSSSCYVRDYTGLSTKSIPSGSLTVSPACNIAGSLRMCQSGACDTFRVQHAQMARDGNTFTLVGYFLSDPDVVAFLDAAKR